MAHDKSSKNLTAFYMLPWALMLWPAAVFFQAANSLPRKDDTAKKATETVESELTPEEEVRLIQILE